LIDASSEETYYPLGIFLSLEDAVLSVESQREPWGLSYSCPTSDFVALEIRERPIGLSAKGKTVWRRKWHHEFFYDLDESRWVWRP
jgi:hypothetical protein